jgi:hypothetical protein
MKYHPTAPPFWEHGDGPITRAIQKEILREKVAQDQRVIIQKQTELYRLKYWLKHRWSTGESGILRRIKELTELLEGWGVAPWQEPEPLPEVEGAPDYSAVGDYLDGGLGDGNRWIDHRFPLK